jgi:hypothetical protein
MSALQKLLQRPVSRFLSPWADARRDAAVLAVFKGAGGVVRGLRTELCPCLPAVVAGWELQIDGSCTARRLRWLRIGPLLWLHAAWATRGSRCCCRCAAPREWAGLSLCVGPDRSAAVEAARIRELAQAVRDRADDYKASAGCRELDQVKASTGRPANTQPNSRSRPVLTMAEYGAEMLAQFADYRRAFIEVTKTVHEHGGPGWEFGTCLWGPSLNKAGHDSYRLLREVKTDDLVLHILEDEWTPGSTEHRFNGRSFVAAPHEVREDQPPNPGDWANQSPYFRVPLRDYESFPETISLPALFELFDDELRAEMKSGPTHYPFILYGQGAEIRLRQGGYINECTPGLFGLMQKLIGENPGSPDVGQNEPLPSTDREFKEAKRLAAEHYAFARNPALVREARAIRGYACEACDFNFENVYGLLGKNYIECHHLDPLGRRDEPTTSTRVSGVRMLCANCHRIVHRERPPMAVETLRAQLGLAARTPPLGG